MIQVLFVCLGNICRSTMAEAVMRHMVEQAGLSHRISVDSAGTGGYHIGQPPHRGTRLKLEEKGISWKGIFARQITPGDMEKFDYIVAMDEGNLRDIQAISKEKYYSKIKLFSSFAPGQRFSVGLHVPDPWYTGDFGETYSLVEQGCQGLMSHLHQRLAAPEETRSSWLKGRPQVCAEG